MSLKIRFRFDGRCRLHPRYNPERDGRPQHNDCPGCEALHVIRLYCEIARRKAETCGGLLVVNLEPRPELPVTSDSNGDNAGVDAES